MSTKLTLGETADYAVYVGTFAISPEFVKACPSALVYQVINKVTYVIEAEGSHLYQALGVAAGLQKALDEFRAADKPPATPSLKTIFN